MPSMPSLWRSEARTTYATTYYHITLAILYMRDKHYWEDSPTTSNGHEFILIVIDYFTKWVETVSHKVLNSKKVDQFIQTDIIYRYGLHFKGETEKLLRQFNIQHHKSSPYHPQTNGVVKAANKKIGRILKKSMKN